MLVNQFIIPEHQKKQELSFNSEKETILSHIESNGDVDALFIDENFRNSTIEAMKKAGDIMEMPKGRYIIP